jgi:hypothetical protein
MFDEKSRYARVPTAHALDRRGRIVEVVGVPEPPDQLLLGYHFRREGQRLDHLAARYLGDPAGFWRICELDGAMLPDALAETREVAIPAKGGRR